MNRLKEARAKAGLTQREVAGRVGISERFYQDYEAYNIMPGVLRALAIAKTLNSTVEYLYGSLSGEEERPTM